MFLTFSMVAAVAGCGSTADSGATEAAKEPVETKAAAAEAETAESTAAEAEANAAEVIDPLGPFEETVTITTVTRGHSTAIYPEGDNATSNVYTRAWKDKLNIDVEFLWESADEYDTKLNLAIASGQIPDVFECNAEQLQQLMEADMLMDLSDVYEEYASDRLKKYQSDYADVYATAMDGEALYGIPEMDFMYVNQPQLLWIRNDWKEELGLKDPETIEDLEEMCLAFMESGKSEYGMAVRKSLDELINLAPAWQAYPLNWVKEEDGSIVFGGVQEEMKDALAVWADWYQKGIIDPDFAVKEWADLTESFINGKAGIDVMATWFGYSPCKNVIENQGNEAIFYAYAIPSATGEEVLPALTFSNKVYTVVSKDCENPGAVIKILNFYAYMQEDAYAWGDVDVDTALGFKSNGMMHIVPFRIMNPDDNYNNYIVANKAVNIGDESVLTTSTYREIYGLLTGWANNQDPTCVGGFLQYDDEVGALSVNSKILEEERYIKDAVWGKTPEVVSEYGSVLSDLLKEGWTKIITGQEDIEYFDTLVENWKTAGGDECTQAINEEFGQ